MRRRNRSATRHHNTTAGRALRFERLEPRALLSVMPIGSEFRVNTYTTNSQSSPAAAMDADGDFVVVWSGQGTGDAAGIFGQRYNAAGVAQGAEFRVNAPTGFTQHSPSVAMDADGDFVVAWSGAGLGDSSGVFAKRYNASGVAQGSEFRVNTFTTDDQDGPAVAMDASGDFVIVWESFGQDGSGEGVYAQRYNAAGVAQGSEFRVNTYTTNSQRSPTVAMDDDGEFVIVWQSNQDGSGGSHGIDGVYAQRYNATGVAQGSEFRVNTYTTSFQGVPSVAMDADGDFVVVWQSAGQDGHAYGVYAQRYNAAGVAQGSEFRVNTYTLSNQDKTTVAIDADGDFVVQWTSAQDGSGYGVYAQVYNSAGAPQGGEFRVNTYTTGIQEGATIAIDADGDFVVVWESNGQDGFGEGVYAQRYLINTPPTTSGIAVIYVPEGAADSIVDLWAAFADVEDADSSLTYTVQSNTTPALFTSTNINAVNGQLTLDYAPNKYGTSMITVRATDTGGKFVETTFSVTIVYPGDYNHNGFVDAPDWVIWRKQSGTTVPPYSGADGDGDGDVDPIDRDIWLAHFGETVPLPGSGSGALAVGQAPPDIASERQAEPDLQAASFFSLPVSNVVPQRPRRALAVRQESRAELGVDNLLLSRTTSLLSDSESHSARARAEREHEQISHRAALDDVFSVLGRNAGRRHGWNADR